MKIGYARIANDERHPSLQVEALRRAGCEQIFTDHGVSGATIERHGLSQALSILSRGDTLVVWKLDRLGRSLGFLIDMIVRFGDQEIGFESISDSINISVTGGKLVFQVMGALREAERSLIAERTKAEMSTEKSGRPLKLTPEQINYAREVIIADRETISGMAAVLNVDRKTLQRALRSKGKTDLLSND